MEIKQKISSLSRKELGKLLTECFFLVGKDLAKLNPLELEAMLQEVFHWKGWMWVDTFREAFSAYSAGELEIEHFSPTLTPMTVSKITKAYKDKTFGRKENQKEPEPTFIPSSDEDYYNSLVHCLNGDKSPKFQDKFPKTIPLRKVSEENSGGVPIIPFTWDWEAVYRHLRTLNQCDEASGKESKKKSVITWIRITWPGVVFQSDLFPRSENQFKTLGEFLRA